MAIKAAPIVNWLPTASHSTASNGVFTIPATALLPNTLLSGSTVPNDVRAFLLGVLDQIFLSYQADRLDDGDAPASFSVGRALQAGQVQYVVSINTTGNVSLPTYD